MREYFLVTDVVRITGASQRQLQYWDETGFLKPSAKTKRRRKYSFFDLIQVRIAKKLLEKGVSLQKIRRSLERIRIIIPGLKFPLSELMLYTDGQNIFVNHRGSRFEAVTGQTMIEFNIEELKLSIDKYKKESVQLTLFNQ